MKRREGSEASLALSVWLRLLKTHNLILTHVRQGIAGRCTLPQFDVMAQVARVPDGITFRDLSRRLLVSAGNLTGIVDRLESDGLVRREVVAHDRRSFRVRLTPSGRRRIAALIPRHRRDLERLLAPIPIPKQRALRRLLGEAERLIEDGAAPPRRTGRPGPLPTTRERGGARVRRAV